MTLSLDSILQFIQDLRSQLEIWGINSETLMAIAVVAAVVFFFSLREVAAWYFRINQVRDEVEALRDQVRMLEQAIRESLHPQAATKEALAPPMGPDELLKIAERMREDSPAPRFNFDH